MNRKPALRWLSAMVVLVAVLLALWALGRAASAAPTGQEDASSLVIAKSVEGGGTIAPGEAVRFHVAVTNTGAITVAGVVVRDDYDESALVKIETGAGSGAQNVEGVITWAVGDLAPGAAWRTSYLATAADQFAAGLTAVSNVASVDAGGVPVADASVTLAVRAPWLSLQRVRARVDDDGDVVPGATVRHTIRYANNGTAGATNVVIEEVYDGAVVQDVANLTAGGQRSEGKIRWNVGAVAAGSSGEVSYEATLKPGLAHGDDIEVRSQATIQADGVESISAVDSFTLRTPLLSLERTREDLSGDTIQPGDSLRFTIKVRNSGEAAAMNVLVQDDFHDQVVAEVSNISSGGSEAEGTVEWVLTEPLEPGEERVFSYEVRLVSEISQSTSVVNAAIVYISGVELARAPTSMTIEPAPAETTTEQPQIFEQRPETLAWLVGVILGVALLAVVGTVLGGPALMKDAWNTNYLMLALEGVVVVVLVGAVLILAMGSGIKQDGAVSILSTIAGYVLGRAMSGLRNGGGS